MPILLFSFNGQPREIVNSGDIYIQGNIPAGAKLLNYNGNIIVEGDVQRGAIVSLIATAHVKRQYKIDAASISDGANIHRIIISNGIKLHCRL